MTTTPNFTLMPGSQSSPRDFDLGYRVLWHKGSFPLLRFSIHAEVMNSMGWNEKTRLQLLVDASTRLGQLKADPKRGRPVHLTNIDGRGECRFFYTTAEEKYFAQLSDTDELTITEKSAENGWLIFQLPINHL